MEKVEREFSTLQQRSKIIQEGLEAVINFEGHEKDNHKFYFHEINNFLDIFIKEAESINMLNDIYHVGKYIQFLRNNQLRLKFNKIFEGLLKEANVS